eukprot:scaffold34913_cov172-Amphora_coffeaeformis.AAC.5
MCQYWASRMFTKEVVGTANALCGGWGNLGGGVTQLVMGSVLFPLFKVFYNDDSEKAWRTVTVVPAVVAMATGIAIYFISDDAPKGNYVDLKKNGSMPEVSAAASFRTGAVNFNTWVLFLQYAGCFGVELTMNNAAALYFKDEFGQSTETAAAIASIFGWMNLFARGLGGFLSDKASTRMGMRGRIWVQFILLLAEGALAAEGSTYGIVPYVDPPSTGSISGIVGAGGNAGAVGFGMGFRQLKYETAFIIMGISILVTAALSVLVNIKGHSAMLWGKDAAPTKQTVSIPEKDNKLTEEVNA